MSSAVSDVSQTVPDLSHVQTLHVDELESIAARTGIRYWRALCGDKKFPSRSRISPRDLVGILRHVLLVRSINDGRDYEFRIVGDAHVQALGVDFSKMRNSEIERAVPEHGALLRVLYDQVRNSGEPVAFRGWLGREGGTHFLVYHESVLMPLGEDRAAVDHILVVSTYVPKIPD